jgi:DNA polymerase V
MGRYHQIHSNAVAVGDLIAVVDCNNFYASCERVVQPDRRGKSVVVLSNNDGSVICVLDDPAAIDAALAASS